MLPYMTEVLKSLRNKQVRPAISRLKTKTMVVTNHAIFHGTEAGGDRGGVRADSCLTSAN